MEVWVAFGIGFFLGGFIGVLALSILFMARDNQMEGTMNKSINEWMIIRKIVGERKQDLKRLRDLSAVDSRVIDSYGDKVKESINTAKYDVKVLDRRIVEMQNADLAIESAIKQSNATTKIDLAVDVDFLLSPVE